MTSCARLLLASLAASVVSCQSTEADTPLEPLPPQAARAGAGGEPALGVATDTRISDQTVEALEALGYLPTAPTDNPNERGVTARGVGSGAGLNLFSSRRRASALLVDLGGESLHRWSVGSTASKSWMHVEPVPDGSGALLAIARDDSLSRYSWNSGLEWRSRMRAHHDVAVHEDGRLFVLVRSRTVVHHQGHELPVLADAVAILSSDGKSLRTLELLRLLRSEVSNRRLRQLRHRFSSASVAQLVRPGGVGDVLHANSIEFLRRSIPGVASGGMLLLSFRALSRIAIVDLDGPTLRWIWGAGQLDGQHDATQLDNGNLLIFDNGIRRGWSRVIEVDPTSGEIAWSFRAPGFFSRLRGGAQALRNGNVLITESDKGHAFEVTRAGSIVWEYWNPDVRRDEGGLVRAVIYRFNRFPADYFRSLPTENGDTGDR